jgi:hypothetical protein
MTIKNNFNNFAEESSKPAKKIYKVNFLERRPQEENLGKFSIVVDSQTKSFSFKQKVEDSIENPNILDTKQDLMVKNKNLPINGLFDSQDDPIYDLDETHDKKDMTKDNKKQKLINNIINFELQTNRGRYNAI